MNPHVHRRLTGNSRLTKDGSPFVSDSQLRETCSKPWCYFLFWTLVVHQGILHVLTLGVSKSCSTRRIHVGSVCLDPTCGNLWYDTSRTSDVCVFETRRSVGFVKPDLLNLLTSRQRSKNDVGLLRPPLGPGSVFFSVFLLGGSVLDRSRR